MQKEMHNVGIAFQVQESDKGAPIGWSKVTGHIIFDVKIDFTRKARWVLDGHKTPNPIGSTYAGVVLRESVRIALTYAALNGLDVQAADIKNAFSKPLVTERLHHMWTGVWIRKCKESSPNIESIVWRKECWE